MPDRAAAAAGQGRWDEGRALYQAAIRGVQNDSPQLRAELTLNLGALQVQSGKVDEALETLESARSQFQELGDELGTAEALHNAGLAHLRAGRGEEAVQTLGQAREVAGKASLLGLLEQVESEQPRSGTTLRDRSGLGTPGFNPLLNNATLSDSLSLDLTHVSSLNRPFLNPRIVTVADSIVAESNTDRRGTAGSPHLAHLTCRLKCAPLTRT